MPATSNDPLDFVAPAGARPLPAPVRHPLGLPAGSVRSLLALLVAGLTWALILTATENTIELPLYLCYLLFLIVGCFFASHGSSIAAGGRPEPSPWYLPRGTVRFLLVLGFALVIGWRTWTRGEFPRFRTDNPADHPYLPLWIIGAFFLGIAIDRFVDAWSARRGGPPAAYQDLLAWVSLIAILGLAVEVVVLFLINPTLEVEQQLNMPKWQTFFAAVVSFYFGARS